MSSSWKKNWGRKLAKVPWQINVDLLGRTPDRQHLDRFAINIAKIFGIAKCVANWKRLDNCDLIEICFFFQERKRHESFEVRPYI